MTITEQHLNLISLNVRGLRNKEKRDAIFRWCNYQKVDILLLQETYWTDNILKIIKNEWIGHCYFCNGTNHSSGVAILISKTFSLPITVTNVFYDCDGRAVMINVIVNHCKLCIVNIYAPTERKNREQFFKKIADWIQEKRHLQYDLIIGGDFNSVLCTQKDVKGNKNNYYKTPIRLKFLVKQFDLCDKRKYNPEKRQFTWRNLLLNVASRLDYWLIHNHLKSKVIIVDIRPAIRCDHNAISIKLKLGDTQKGPGYWKLNNKVLNDYYYKRQIKNIVGNIEKENVNFGDK